MKLNGQKKKVLDCGKTIQYTHDYPSGICLKLGTVMKYFYEKVKNDRSFEVLHLLKHMTFQRY